MDRNDYILMTSFIGALITIVLISFAPVTGDATLTMKMWAVSGSPIVIGIVSTAIAAFAGTWGAQLLAVRTARRRELLTELRATNTALGLVFNITNMYIVAKKQHIAAIVREHETQCEQQSKTNSDYTVYVQLDFRTLYPPLPLIADLNKLLREEITVGTKAIILFTQLSQSVSDLAHTISERNRWIDEVRRMSGEYSNRDKMARMFLGIPYIVDFPQEQTDTRYSDYIAALKLQVDDCIAFSVMLGQLLTNYGRIISQNYGHGAPKTHELRFTGLEEYLPNMSAYQSWGNISL
jgi:hypothetical protein